MDVARRRHEAALKAWKTRRRRARISPTMRKVLEFLNGDSRNRLAVHFTGKVAYWMKLTVRQPNGSEAGLPSHLHGRRGRVRVTTFRALERRGWVEADRRWEWGGVMGTLSDGTQGVVERIYDFDYRLSDKGRQALETST